MQLLAGCVSDFSVTKIKICMHILRHGCATCLTVFVEKIKYKRIFLTLALTQDSAFILIDAYVNAYLSVVKRKPKEKHTQQKIK